MLGRITLTLAWVGLVAGLAGCGSSGPPQVQAAPPVPPPPKRVPLDELLKKPRAEIVSRGDDVQTDVRLREEARKKEKITFEFLPKWYQPVVIPGFQDQKYDKDLGFSVPSYVDPKDGAQLRELALQYARIGDAETALKLVGEKGLAELERYQLDKNYPIEWTRYVALEFHSLQQHVAIGEPDAVHELLAFHQELDKLLDEKAKQSLLGQTLLARGRRTLDAARTEYKNRGNQQAYDEVEAALKDWPQTIVALPLNESKDRWAELLRTKASGRVVSCQPPTRALDLLQLPLPYEAADAFFLFFDGKDHLEEIVVAYNLRLQSIFPRPGDLVGVVSNWSAPTELTPTECHQRWGSLVVDTRYSPFESAISGWVRLHLDRPAAEATAPRDLGAVHLDWSFEHNRLHSAPNVLGNPLTLKEGGQLNKVENPLPAGKLQDVTLQSVEGHPDLLASGKYTYKVGVSWHELAMPVFALLGPGKWYDERSENLHGHVRLTWEDGKTQLNLIVPHQPRDPVILTHADKRDAAAAPARHEEVAGREAADRRQRIDAGQPLVRLPRKVDAFPLGAPREEVLKYMPRGQDAYRVELPDGLVVTNNAPLPKDKSPSIMRQVIVRFDHANKLRWVRVRYEPNLQPQIGKKDGPDFAQALLGYWRQQGGSVASQPPPRAAVLADLPAQPGGTYFRWDDDLSEVSFLHDRNGVELTVRDLTADVEGKALMPLRYLPRGPAEGIPGLTLGIAKAELEKKLENKPVVNEEGAWVIALTKGKYDIAAVWFDGMARVSKVAMRYRQSEAPKSGHKDMEKQLNDRWGAELRHVGWPIRRDVSNQGAMQAYAWLDDATRYRLYWADSDNSPPRLWSEWRDLESGSK